MLSVHHTCHPSSSFFPLLYYCNKLSEDLNKCAFSFFSFHKLNSSPLPGPFTGKRSERILEFHQLPSPLDISLMNWRAHTTQWERKGRWDIHRLNEKAREREREREVSVEDRRGWKNSICFTDLGVIYVIITIPSVFQWFDIRSTTALWPWTNVVNVNYRLQHM